MNDNIIILILALALTVAVLFLIYLLFINKNQKKVIKQSTNKDLYKFVDYTSNNTKEQKNENNRGEEILKSEIRKNENLKNSFFSETENKEKNELEVDECDKISLFYEPNNKNENEELEIEEINEVEHYFESISKLNPEKSKNEIKDILSKENLKGKIEVELDPEKHTDISGLKEMIDGF